jgi:osmotically-inducible protein OsmY
MVLIALAGLGGCQKTDTDILARVGRGLARKAEAATANSRLLSGWQAVRANLDEVAVDARVAARLSWDQTLTGQPIQVLASGSRVELHGTVSGTAERRRAVELAESTVGVAEVADALEVAAPEP